MYSELQLCSSAYVQASRQSKKVGEMEKGDGQEKQPTRRLLLASPLLGVGSPSRSLAPSIFSYTDCRTIHPLY